MIRVSVADLPLVGSTVLLAKLKRRVRSALDAGETVDVLFPGGETQQLMKLWGTDKAALLDEDINELWRKQ